MRIIFMGTPEFAVFSLKAILTTDNQVVGVVTKPDRPLGRGQKVIPSPIKKLAVTLNLPLMQPEKVREEAFINQLIALSPDVIVVVAYGQILPGSILSIPGLGCINLHASLLPEYRGPAPIHRTIINGKDVTGVTIIKMDEGMDTGNILLQREIPVKKDERVSELYQRLAGEGAALLVEALSGLSAGDLRPSPQRSKGVSYAPPLKKDDGLINWSKSGKDILNLIRGLDPIPGAFTHLSGKRLKIFSGFLVGKKEGGKKPGEICEINKKGIKVACGDGCLFLKEVQLENKKRMPIETFLLGIKIESGIILK